MLVALAEKLPGRWWGIETQLPFATHIATSTFPCGVSFYNFPLSSRIVEKRQKQNRTRFPSALFLWTILVVFGPMEKDVLYTTMIMTFTVGVDLGFVLGRFLLIFYHIASMTKKNVLCAIMTIIAGVD